MYCSNCGAKIGDDASFCWQCGAAVAKPMSDSEVSPAAEEDGCDKTQVIDAITSEDADDAACANPSLAEGATQIIGAVEESTDKTQVIDSLEASNDKTQVIEDETAMLDWSGASADRTQAIPSTSAENAVEYAGLGATSVMPQVGQTASTNAGSNASSNRTEYHEANVVKKNRTKLIVGIVIAVVVVVVAVLAIVIGTHVSTTLHNNQLEDERIHSEHAITLSIDAPGYDEANDTRIPVEVRGATFEGDLVEEVFFVTPSNATLSFMAGEYNITFPASPLCANGSIYDFPTDTCHLSVSEDLAKDEALDASLLPSASFQTIDTLDITDEEISNAYHYAAKDTQNTSRADNNKAAVIAARNAALDKAAEEAARLEAEAQRASEIADFKSQLDQIDSDLITSMTAKRSDGEYEIHTTGVFMSTCENAQKKYTALSSKVGTYLSNTDKTAFATAQTENSAVGLSGWKETSPELYKALSLHIDLTKEGTKGDEKTEQTDAKGILCTRDMIVRCINAM